MKKLIYMDEEELKNWARICQDVIDNNMKKEVMEASRRMSSIHWLSGLLPEAERYAPPLKFWPASRYSSKQRSAAITRIPLLIGHSVLATGIIRRHTDQSRMCPLCNAAEETLEHLVFECQKLSQIRENVQSFQGITMNRSLGAVEFIIGANRKEELLLHRIYSARVQAELHAGTGSCV